MVVRGAAPSRSVVSRAARAMSAVCLAALGGCAVGADDAPATTASPAPLEGLTASLYQTRLDVAVRQLEVRLTNDTGSDLTLRDVRLVSSAFDAPMSYARTGSLLTAGRVVDLPVALADPVCDGPSGTHTVHLGQVAALHDAECFAEQVREVAVLALRDPPAVRELGGATVADLTVRVEPTGEPGRLEIGRVGSTTLLEQVDPVTGERLREGYAVGLTLDGADPTGFTFTVVPGRCDAHAVAEDKQGTLFRVDVVLDGQAGQVTVASPTAVTSALYGFVREACGS